MITQIPTLTAMLGILVAVPFCIAQEESTPSGDRKKEKVRPLLVLPKEAVNIKNWMKVHGWKTQRGNPRHFRVESNRLCMMSSGDSVAIGLDRGFPLQPGKWPRIRFRILIESIPTGTDFSRTSGDDAAFRLFVAFDRNGGWFHPPNTIAYTWTETAKAGRVFQSPHFKQLHYLSIGKGVPGKMPDGKGKWITIERDLRKDYHLVFPGDKKGVPALKGILLKCDSNNTGTSAKVWVNLVELVQ